MVGEGGQRAARRGYVRIARRAAVEAHVGPPAGRKDGFRLRWARRRKVAQFDSDIIGRTRVSGKLGLAPAQIGAVVLQGKDFFPIRPVSFDSGHLDSAGRSGVIGGCVAASRQRRQIIGLAAEVLGRRPVKGLSQQTNFLSTRTITVATFSFPLP